MNGRLLPAVFLAGCPTKHTCGEHAPVPTDLNGDWVIEEVVVVDAVLDDLRVHIEGDTLEMRYLVDGVEHLAVYTIGE